LYSALQNFRVLIGDAHFGVGDDGAAVVLNRACDGAGGATLSESLSDECSGKKKDRDQT